MDNIRILESAEDLIKLHYTEDDVEVKSSFSRNEWIQWLMSFIENPALVVFGNVDDKKITSYLVAYNSVDPPISDHVFIIYFWPDASEEVNKKYINEVRKWAKAIGAKSIEMATSEPRSFYKYGFSESQEVMVELKV